MSGRHGRPRNVDILTLGWVSITSETPVSILLGPSPPKGIRKKNVTMSRTSPLHISKTKTQEACICPRKNTFPKKPRNLNFHWLQSVPHPRHPPSEDFQERQTPFESLLREGGAYRDFLPLRPRRPRMPDSGAQAMTVTALRIKKVPHTK